MNRRSVLQMLAAAAAAGLVLDDRRLLAGEMPRQLYDLPAPGDVSLLHITDCHAPSLPTHGRQPRVKIGAGAARGQPPHLAGAALLKHYGIAPRTPHAHAFTALEFEQAARAYGRTGGFAHLATLVKQVRASRPNAL